MRHYFARVDAFQIILVAEIVQIKTIDDEIETEQVKVSMIVESDTIV